MASIGPVSSSNLKLAVSIPSSIFEKLEGDYSVPPIPFTVYSSVIVNRPQLYQYGFYEARSWLKMIVLRPSIIFDKSKETVVYHVPVIFTAFSTALMRPQLYQFGFY